MTIESVQNLILPPVGDRPGGLFPYQLDAINKLFDKNKRFLFLNHGTGCGKTITSCAIMQELVNRGEIDEIVFFTMRKMKINIQRMIEKFTDLEAVVIDGMKAKRKKGYETNPPLRVMVLNYERANFDQELLAAKLRGKRVLFVMDEIQKILVYTGGKPNKAGQGVQKLTQLVDKDSWFLPMSATVINYDPERYFRVFDYAPTGNPLKNITNFRKTYSDGTIIEKTPWGTQVKYRWNLDKLAKVKEVVSDYVHLARKSDPGVKEFFKSTEFEVVPIQLSDEDRELYEIVKEAGSEDEDELWGQYYRVMQYICNTAESLKFSKSEIAKTIAENWELSSQTSSKIEVLVEMVKQIQEQGDKVVVFTKYTNLGLFLISNELERNHVNHVVHYGSGMTDKAAQMAQDRFKKDPGVIVFLSSDAGSHGLSFQEARYVINFDVPHSYDLLTQRNDRIDRADSYLDGLTSYVFICEDTLEERIWKIMNHRREMSGAVQGTTEEFSRSLEEDNLEYLMFG